MAIAYAALTTFALCDAATRKLTFRVKSLTTRDAVLDLAEDRADLSQEAIAAQLLKVNGQLAEVAFKLTQPGLDPVATATLTDDEDALKIQRRRLERRATQVAGLDEFLADVDAEEVDVRVAKLEQVLAGIVAHRATLTV